MIVWIDDEQRKISSYLEDLELDGFNVQTQSNVDDAIDLIAKNKGAIELCILDIMISPGQLFKTTDTLLGRRTGVHLFEYIRRSNPDIPFIVLTNVNAPDVQTRFDREPHCWWFRKDQLFPHELVDQVRRILTTGKTQEGGAL